MDCSLNDEVDDAPQLSMETLAALQEFYEEQDEINSEKNNSKVVVNFKENWQLSQFWYDENTREELSNIILQTIGKHGKVALISCPSLYPIIKSKIEDEGEVHLYELDRRFCIYEEDFIYYNYNYPLNIPKGKASFYDLVVADPPFLSEECLSKTSETIKFLTKRKMILCTGAVMASLAERFLNVSKIDFEPKHKNNLGNEFWVYTNFCVNIP